MSAANVPIEGEVYNSLTLTGKFSFVMTKEGRRQMVEAICRCGTVKSYALRHLRTGNTQSCGCVRKEKLLASKITHHLSKNPLYSVYQDMKRRCYDKKCSSFKDYGARGIKVCDEWLNDPKAFCDWGVANGYEKGLELDREYNDGGYEPSNCRFVTRAVGNRNTRRNKYITAFGETKTVTDWAHDERCNISEPALFDRMRDKRWSPEDAITFTPNAKKKETARSSDSARMLRAFGEVKSIIDWSEDSRCAVGYSGLKGRLRRGWEYEKAISHPKEQISERFKNFKNVCKQR